ncbi:hypothetical protein E4T42_09360 [Aureobasidium subglaciale]|nr:hypothetical protein E4T42_09360 [Aureobasidium subglaciale]
MPLIGNLLQLKSARGDIEHQWQRSLVRYGEMATVHLGSKTWIFLNSTRVVNEIIAKRGSQTNGRSPMPIASGIISKSGRSLLLPPDGWTERRRVMHGLLNGTALKQYGEWQELESTQMMAEYLLQPHRWFRHHYRYANSVVHRIALGQRLVKSGKELSDLQDVVTTFVGSIGESLIDWFPQLDNVPRFLQFWRPHWEKIGEWNYNIYHEWWQPVRKEIENGTAPPSFVRDVLLNPESKYTGSDQDAMYVAMQLIEAGSDTTREVLNTFVMAAICYPDTFARARNEVDSICGKDGALRMPGLADLENMPYVCAIIKELLRWRPIFQMSPDHCATTDIHFEGFIFPAGTGFVINEIAISDECEDAEHFKPERWLDGHETDVSHGIWQFGGGRRICVGYRLAQRGLFINIARLALCYDFTTVSNSQELTEVSIRSKKYEDLVKQEAEAAGVFELAKGEI